MKNLFRFLGTLFRKGTTTRCALTASNSQQSEQTPMVQAWWHLNAKYKFRLNSLSGKLEMCERRTIEKEGQPEAEDAFREVTRLDRNQLLMELQEAGTVRPYFTQEENKEVERRNRAFCAPLRLRQLLDERFEVVPVEGAKPSDGLTATEAFDRLVLADAELMKRYNERNFGEQLINAGFVQLRSNSRRAYNIRPKLGYA